jgi:hypothetical protein
MRNAEREMKQKTLIGGMRLPAGQAGNVQYGMKERIERKEKGYGHQGSQGERSSFRSDYPCSRQAAGTLHDFKLADCPSRD